MRSSLRFTLTLLIALTVSLPALALEGSHLTIELASDAVDGPREIGLYLPPGYNPAGDSLYPALLFLHGGNSQPSDYHFVFDVVDQAIAEGTIDPLVVLLPDGRGGSWMDLSWWVDSELNGDFGTLLSSELSPWLGDACRVRPDRYGLAVMGHSMGGFGAARLALAHPQQYRAAVSLSGMLDLPQFIEGYAPTILSENGGSGPFAPSAGYWSQIMFSMAEALSPEPDNSPWPVALPLADDGSLVDSVIARWRSNNPADLASAGSDMDLYFDCGSSETVYQQANAVFADSLTAAGIPFRQDTISGGHDSNLPERVRTGLIFLDSLFALEGPGVLRAGLHSSGGQAQATLRLSSPPAGELHLELCGTGGDSLSGQLFDDGQHGDGDAGDGLYGTSIDLPETVQRFSPCLFSLPPGSPYDELSLPGGLATGSGVQVSDLTLTAPLQPGGMVTVIPSVQQSPPASELDSLRAWLHIAEPGIATDLTGNRHLQLPLPDLPGNGEPVTGPSFFLMIDPEATAGQLLPLDIAFTQQGRLFWTQRIVLEIGSDMAADPPANSPPGSFTIESVHPNPVNGQATITLALAAPGQLRLALHNLLGQRVRQWNHRASSAGQLRVTLPAEGLASGLYFLHVRTGQATATRRITLLQ